MKFMENLSISKKLLTGFGIMMVIVLIVGLFGIYGVQKTKSATDTLYEDTMPTISSIDALETNFLEERIHIYRVALFAYMGNWSAAEVELDALSVTEQKSVALAENYVKATADDAGICAMAEMTTIYENEYQSIKEQLRALVKAQDLSTGAAVLSQAAAPTELLVQGIGDIKAFSYEAADQMMLDLQKQTNRFVYSSIAILLVSLLVAVAFIFSLTKMIAGPLKFLSFAMKGLGDTGNFKMDNSQESTQMAEKMAERKDELGQMVAALLSFMMPILDKISVMERLADGDLSTRVNYISSEDTMARALSAAISNLNDMMQRVKETSVQVRTASEQIASGGQSLAQGSTEQAASIQEISAAIAEVSNSASQNAQRASEAAIMADNIKADAERNGDQMKDMMVAVTDINESSNSISRVIKVIDDIAFQTNILALNAAVEAARAGQHGKGFAVVAEEVRNLAAKSAEAAKNTSEMIADSIQKANRGYTLAADSVESLEKIVNDINDCAAIVGQISTASTREADAVAQINVSVEQVSQVVQQNSATAEESAAASEELTGQAHELQEHVGRFILADTQNQLHTSPLSGKETTLPKHTAERGFSLKY